MPTPKIILDFQKLENLNSGLGQFCLHLGTNLTKFNRQRFQLFFVVPSGRKGVFGEAAGYFYPSEVRKTSIEFDLLYLAHQEARMTCKAKYRVYSIHDLNFLYKYSGLKKKLKSFFLRKRVESADGLIFISGFSQSEFFAQYPNIHKPSCIIYNGLPKPAVPRKPAAIKDDKPFFLCLGIVSAKKNVHVLVPMMKYFPECTLIIAGNQESAYARNLQKEVNNNNLDQQIVFTGEISEEEKAWYLSNCKALLFPSVSEGFGLPLIEAFHFGKPVFCSRLTSLPEIGGNNAFYWDSFEPQIMAKTIIGSLGKWTEIDSHAVIERSRQFNWETAALQYLNFFDLMVKRDPKNTPEEKPR